MNDQTLLPCFLEDRTKHYYDDRVRVRRCYRCKRATGVILHFERELPSCDENGNPIEPNYKIDPFFRNDKPMQPIPDIESQVD